MSTTTIEQLREGVVKSNAELDALLEQLPTNAVISVKDVAIAIRELKNYLVKTNQTMVEGLQTSEWAPAQPILDTIVCNDNFITLNTVRAINFHFEKCLVTNMQQ